MAASPSRASQARLEIHPARLGFPEIEEIGRINYTRAFSSLPTHRHPGAMELYYLFRGRQTYVAAGKPFALKGGDLFFTLPGEPHGTQGRPREKTRLYWARFRLAGIGRWPSLPRAEANDLRRALLSLKRRPFNSPQPFKKKFDEIIACFHDPTLPLRQTVLRVKLLELILAFLSAARRPAEAGEKDILPELLSFIDENVAKPLSVTDLAQKSGYSASWLKALFKRETGIPPREYVLRKKIEAAQTLLKRAGKSITDAAFDLGFPSSQYFATVFKRITGTTPRAFLGLK